MLTANLVRVRFHRDRIIPRYLDAENPDARASAAQLIAIYRSAAGRSRGELAAELGESPCDPGDQLIQQGLIKLLDERCEFEISSDHPPNEIRERVFALAAERRQDATFDRSAVVAAAAGQLGLPAAAIESGLFADLKNEQRLQRFDDITAERLLHRYNLALAQGVLLKAVRVEVEVRRETPARLRTLIRRIKFHRLICAVTSTGSQSCRFALDGPLSLFSATQRYGFQLASFLPAVVSCKDFRLDAELRWGVDRKPKTFSLTSDDGLLSESETAAAFVPDELTMFADQFRARITDWRLVGESSLLPLGDSFWAPDFRLEHLATGRSVFLDVLGYWRRSSAERHLDRLRQFAPVPFIVAVSDSLHLDEGAGEPLPVEIVRFRQMPLPTEIARRAAAILGIEAT